MPSRQQQDSPKSIRVGIVGISRFGGGEAVRLVAGHPHFELVYGAGEGSAGSLLRDRFPGVPANLADLVIERAKLLWRDLLRHARADDAPSRAALPGKPPQN